jgi:hypothetical protein
MTKPMKPSPVNPLHDLPDQGRIHVPPGRTLADVPKSGPKPTPSGAPKKPNTRCTLRQLLTDFDSKDYLIPFLVEMGTKRAKGPWKGYLEFYRANQSGDVDSMKPEIKTKCEKMVKDLNDNYLTESDL